MAAYEESDLFKRTLAAKNDSDDPYQSARELLRTALAEMRRKAAQIVAQIPSDCKNLTVHDVSHLDALWEMADLIAGPNFEMTPAEAFVFGAAVLVHDSGMCIAAFPKGLPEVQSTVAWRNASFHVLTANAVSDIGDEIIQNPPHQYVEEILFRTLRFLHASQAEKLAVQAWRLPHGEEVRLLDNQTLRDTFGESIGRIAHSHHWNIEDLPHELKAVVGGVPDEEFPRDWKVNEIKVACLLRCADAAHIDRRRAPTLLYAATHPVGISADHWNFQNKLNKPVSEKGTLLYTGRDFQVSDATAWWLCFDTVSMIDRELRDSDGILRDIESPTFQVTKVSGADNPDILAKHIKTIGWRPVRADIKVSDPIQLVESLGGRNLYGDGAFAPIRELVQNAVDAVRHRRRIKKLAPDFGEVRVTLDRDPDGKTWLHIDDQGLGMSERVLTGPLLDFGRSYWNSRLMEEEYPGFDAASVNPVGKFGIGFFSVFLLGTHVKVISRRCDAGDLDVRVLEFDTLSARPLLRKPNENELPLNFVTRISVAVDSRHLAKKEPRRDRRNRLIYDTSRHLRASIPEMMSEWLPQLIASVDVKIHIENCLSGQTRVHTANWNTKAPGEFLDELLAPIEPDIRKEIIALHVPSLKLLEDADGKVLGRAAVLLISSDHSDRRQLRGLEHVSVGGFAYRAGLAEEQYIGVFAGDTDDASRRYATSTISDEVKYVWASEQASVVDKRKLSTFEQMRLCRRILHFGGVPNGLPFCLAEGREVTWDKMKDTFSNFESVMVLLKHDYQGDLEVIDVIKADSELLIGNVLPNVILMHVSKTIIVRGSDSTPVARDVVTPVLELDESDICLQALQQCLTEWWGGEPILSIRLTDTAPDRYHFRPALRPVLEFRRKV